MLLITDDSACVPCDYAHVYFTFHVRNYTNYTHDCSEHFLKRKVYKVL